MPGLSATVADEIAALTRVAGPKAAALIRREPDPTIETIVAGWPRDFDTRRDDFRRDHPRPYRGRARREDRVKAARAPPTPPAPAQIGTPALAGLISERFAHAQIRRQPLHDVRRAPLPRPLRRGGGSGLRGGGVPFSLRSSARGDRRTPDAQSAHAGSVQPAARSL